MNQKIITRNRKKFLAYNELRKQMFTEFSPNDSEIILYLLPWLLSINHIACPGYLHEIDTFFRVFDIGNHKGILKREQKFKSLFNIITSDSLLIAKPRFRTIQGLYTIGSIGTISQTSESDCDIWLCYDKNDFTSKQLKQLKKKVYLIGEWLEENCRIPVHFFILDTGDIQNCKFGSVDEESSGSAQANVLKEEFYRTCMLITGKIPLWWVCYDSKNHIDYQEALRVVSGSDFWEDDFVDLGDLEKVEAEECFGAALWQIQKSLDSPLKSFIKMLILKMQLEASLDELVCHKFRQHIMIKQADSIIPDPSVFSMFFLMNYCIGKGDNEITEFVKKCYYLRCQIKPYSKKFLIKKKLANQFFNQFEIDKEDREKLSRFSRWDLESQISFGRQIFRLLLKSYREIVDSRAGVTSQMGEKDRTVVGRKIQVYYESKKSKIVILPKSTTTLNVSGLTFRYDKNKWCVYTGSDNEKGRIIEDEDIVFAVAFVVRNKLFEAGRMHMLPNSTSISLSEIINLGSQIEDFFIKGGNRYKHSDYLKKSYLTKILVVISFEEEPWEKASNKFRIIYMNSWGEMFVKNITSADQLATIMQENRFKSDQTVVDFYLQKKCINYKEILNDIRRVYYFRK